ncbi:vacuolar carboxypeptidase Y [Yamadazyma tenuis ATCC 10573]|uniref:Vacuolar carboxypeptidase Y n=2 Tax=Candida tenuis TaxID=2315449 RepID=G3AWS8_CANTC|nr:vacuolar carboxypeptidase Y [Yamadazyma tenuis ATCC 10573]EGV66606.1 vacuolar carboxypeptidase Y [Yamadazyma tenuis ATCC 10573]
MNIDVIRPASRLNSSSPVKITAVYYDKEKLYVGFASGDFSIYDVDIITESDQRKAPSITSFKSLTDIRTYFMDTKSSNFHHDMTFPNVNGDSTPVSRIEIVSNNSSTNRIIFAITNNDIIRIFEKIGNHLNLIQVMDETKAYHELLVYEVNGKKHMTVGVKKKLIIFEMVYKTRNLFRFNKISEQSLKERVKAISCMNLQLGLHLIIGLSNDFLLVDVNDDFRITGLFPENSDNNEMYYYFNHSTFSYFGLSSSGPSIRILKANEDEYCLIKDNQIIILSSKDSAISVKESNVKLSASPVFLSFIYPSYLLVVYNKKVEIIDLESGELVQKIHHQINSNSIPVFVNDAFIFLGANTDLIQFNILNFQQQIDQYLRFGFGDDRRNSKKDPKTDLALVGLQRALKFVEKIDEEDEFFGGSRVGKEKKKQLMLRDLNKQRAFILFERYGKYHESLIEICSDWLVSYKDVLDLFPDFLKREFYDRSNATIANEALKNTRNVVKKITLDELQQSKLNALTTADSATEVENDRSSKATLTSRMPSTIFGQTKSQNLRKFGKAINNLIIYLTDQRRIHLAFLNDEGFFWKGINITPVDLYDFITPELMTSSLNQIAIEIDTCLFLCYFYCKPMLLGPLLRLPNNCCDASIVNQCLLSNHDSDNNFLKELLDFYFGRKLHKEALEMLYKLAHEDNDNEALESGGISHLTIQYLQKLGNIELGLVFEHSKWLLTDPDQDPMLNGKLIFMNETYECESYDNFKVLEYFVEVICSEELAVEYLEWIIFESDFNDQPNKQHIMPKFHTKLCLMYLNILKEMDRNDAGFETSEPYQKLYKFLQTTSLYEPWTVLKHIPTNEVKLLRFTIFIYKRLGEHDKAIDVLYGQLDDLDSAIKYCSDIYTENNKDLGTKLLHKLLEDLLMNYTENTDSISKLLKSQGSKMDTLRVLTSLPPSFPVRKLDRFLSNQYRMSKKTLVDSRLASQLYKVGNIKLQHELLMRSNKSYTIESSKKLCPICKKRLGYSVFTVRNDQIVHYACYQTEVGN